MTRPIDQSNVCGAFHCYEALDFLRRLPSGLCDLVFASPPYEKARLLDGQCPVLSGEEWVSWMHAVVKESLRCCRGLVAFVIDGITLRHQWSAVPALLMADLHRDGITLRKPVLYHRLGIPGFRGDWLRNNYEFVLCATNGGPLPWSMPLACGTPPVFPAGGPLSFRRADGSRFNRCPDGSRLPDPKPYVAPKLANPGNIVSCIVGGSGKMGDRLCHENEAPFPEKLAEFFIRSFCPPKGIVCDIFGGSGTTTAVAAALGRRWVYNDMRESQCRLAARRHKRPVTLTYPDPETPHAQ